jgi:hypothetical protein
MAGYGCFGFRAPVQRESCGPQLTFKFLVQPDLSDRHAAEALGAFFDLMASIFAGTIPPDTLASLERTRVVGRTLLLAYDFTSHTIVGVDPMPVGPVR